MYELGVGWLVGFKAHLKCGLRFSLHSFLRALASGHELTVNQFTLNSYNHINVFISLNLSFGVKPLVSTFLQYCKVISEARGCFYYLEPRGTTALKYNFT